MTFAQVQEIETLKKYHDVYDQMHAVSVQSGGPIVILDLYNIVVDWMAKQNTVINGGG